MRALVGLAVLGLVLAGLIWGYQRLRGTFSDSLPGTPRPPALDGSFQERAAVAYGPDRGPGLLRLTPSQVVFAADSGRVVVIERLEIVGVSDTRELPDHSVAQPVLAVTTRSDTYYFAVRRPGTWEQLLT